MRGYRHPLAVRNRIVNMEKHQNFISKPEIQFWVPIIVYAVTLTISFMLLSNKIDLLTQRVEGFQERIALTDARVTKFADNLNDYIGVLRAHIGQ